MQIKGTVSKLFSRDWKNKTFHSFALEGDDRFFGTGTVKHKDINVGNKITFNGDKNDKGYWEADTKSVELVTKSDPASADSSAVSGSSTGRTAGVDWVAKDRVIEAQSRRNSAIAMVQLLSDNAALKLPTKKENMYDTIVSLVQEWEDIYQVENENVRQGKAIRNASAESGDVPENAKADSEAEEPWEEN